MKAANQSKHYKGKDPNRSVLDAHTYRIGLEEIENPQILEKLLIKSLTDTVLKRAYYLSLCYDTVFFLRLILLKSVHLYVFLSKLIMIHSIICNYKRSFNPNNEKLTISFIFRSFQHFLIIDLILFQNNNPFNRPNHCQSMSFQIPLLLYLPFPFWSCH